MSDSEKLRQSLTTMITEKVPHMESQAGDACKEKILELWIAFYSGALELVNNLQCAENINLPLNTEMQPEAPHEQP